MSLTEFDQEEYDRNRYNEGFEDGVEQGSLKKAVESAKKLLRMGLSTVQVAEGVGLSLEEVEKLRTC